MKRNILFLLELLLISWILFIFFTYGIALIVSTLAIQKYWLYRILNSIVGGILFISWLLIWFMITKRMFENNLKKFKNGD
jgi:arginine exporter protein ArgO